MRRVLRVLVLGGLVVWLLRRRPSGGPRGAEGVTIGFEDGTSIVLEVGSAERELVLAAAGELV